MKKVILSAIFLTSLIFSSSKAHATWLKEGPIQLTKLGAIDVLISQLDAVNINVTLLDDQNRTITAGKAEERRIRFDMLPPGSYYLYVHTDGFAPINIYTYTKYFSFVNEN